MLSRNETELQYVNIPLFYNHWLQETLPRMVAGRKTIENGARRGFWTSAGLQSLMFKSEVVVNFAVMKLEME